MNTAEFRAMDKAELHVHLEGAVRPERLLEFAREQPHHPFAGLDVAGLRARFRTSSFMAFIDNFLCGYRLLRKADHFQKVTEDLLEDLTLQGVSRAHILYSSGVYFQKLGVPLAEIHRGIAAGLAHFPNLQVKLILDTVLNLGRPFMQRTLTETLALDPHFAAGFSVGGGDPTLDMREFVPLFHQASKAGMFCVAHVGEVDGPENIDTLLRETDVIRIAHGCNAVKSEATLATLARRQIVVDVSLTSNLFTGAVASLEEHPLPIFRARGIPVTLNTDDPLYFATDLEREYRLALQLPGVDEAALREMAATSLRAFAEVAGGGLKYQTE